MSNPLQRLPYLMLCGRRTFKHLVKKIKTTWLLIKNIIARWRGTKYVLIGMLFRYFNPNGSLNFFNSSFF